MLLDLTDVHMSALFWETETSETGIAISSMKLHPCFWSKLDLGPSSCDRAAILETKWRAVSNTDKCSVGKNSVSAAMRLYYRYPADVNSEQISASSAGKSVSRP